MLCALISLMLPTPVNSTCNLYCCFQNLSCLLLKVFLVSADITILADYHLWLYYPGYKYVEEHEFVQNNNAVSCS